MSVMSTSTNIYTPVYTSQRVSRLQYIKNTFIKNSIIKNNLETTNSPSISKVGIDLSEKGGYNFTTNASDAKNGILNASAFDINGDNIINQEEYTAFAAFADKNRDGKISISELSRFSSVFLKYDKNTKKTDFKDDKVKQKFLEVYNQIWTLKKINNSDNTSSTTII